MWLQQAQHCFQHDQCATAVPGRSCGLFAPLAVLAVHRPHLPPPEYRGGTCFSNRWETACLLCSAMPFCRRKHVSTKPAKCKKLLTMLRGVRRPALPCGQRARCLTRVHKARGVLCKADKLSEVRDGPSTSGNSPPPALECPVTDQLGQSLPRKCP